MFGIRKTVQAGAGLPVKATRAFASVRRLTGRQRPALCGSRADRSSTAVRESSKREIRLALREVNASPAGRGVAFRTRARKLTGSLSVWQPRLRRSHSEIDRDSQSTTRCDVKNQWSSAAFDVNIFYVRIHARIRTQDA